MLCLNGGGSRHDKMRVAAICCRPRGRLDAQQVCRAPKLSNAYWSTEGKNILLIPYIYIYTYFRPSRGLPKYILDGGTCIYK